MLDLPWTLLSVGIIMCTTVHVQSKFNLLVIVHLLLTVACAEASITWGGGGGGGVIGPTTNTNIIELPCSLYLYACIHVQEPAYSVVVLTTTT